MEYFILEFLNQNLYIKILSYILLGSFFIQIFFYLFFYIRVFSLRKTHTEKHNNFPLSVIICAKNEAKNLELYLESVLEQDYNNFEVIVVNDSSEDKTNDVLNAYKEKYENLYVTHLEENGKFSHGKKLAVTIGVKAAKNEKIVFTDADCKPETRYWLQAIADSYTSSSKEIVAGYGGYMKGKGFLNKIIRYDTLFTAMQYMTFAKAGLPYMAVGRNMSYTKKIYNSVKGFSSHYHIMSGDDDLFINEVATRKNISIAASPESFVRSVPKKSFSDYIHQKRRHLSTGKYYKLKHKAILGLEVFSRTLFYVSLTFLFVLGVFPEIIAGIFVFRLILKYIILGKASIIFNEKYPVFFAFLFDILVPLINLWTLMSKYFIKNKIKHKW